MSSLTIGQIIKKYKLAKSTLHRKMENGEISFTRNDNGDRVVDEAELHRVLGETIKNRQNEEIETGLKTGSWNSEKLAEFYDMKAKWQIAEAKNESAEVRIQELEEDRNSWKEIAQRLSLPAPKPVPETNKETQIIVPQNSPAPPKSTNETKNDGSLKPAVELNSTVPGEGRVVPRNQSWVSKFFGKKDKK